MRRARFYSFRSFIIRKHWTTHFVRFFSIVHKNWFLKISVHIPSISFVSSMNNCSVKSFVLCSFRKINRNFFHKFVEKKLLVQKKDSFFSSSLELTIHERSRSVEWFWKVIFSFYWSSFIISCFFNFSK